MDHEVVIKLEPLDQDVDKVDENTATDDGTEESGASSRQKRNGSSSDFGYYEDSIQGTIAVNLHTMEKVKLPSAPQTRVTSPTDPLDDNRYGSILNNLKKASAQINQVIKLPPDIQPAKKLSGLTIIKHIGPNNQPVMATGNAVCDSIFMNLNRASAEISRAFVGNAPELPKDKSNKSLCQDRREGPYPCDKCEKIFNGVKSLRLHQRVHRRGGSFKCTECEKDFTSEFSLKSHQIVHSERHFQCSCCGRTFKGLPHLQSHERAHAKKRENAKTYQCQICKEVFETYTKLRAHSIVHANERPFPCKSCDLSFRKAYELRYHEKIHSEVRDFQCSFCGRKFIRQYELTVHERTHTGEKPYQCAHCERKFAKKGNLRKHEKVHSGIKPHKCRFCEKRFRERFTLRTHERLHTGEEPYHCKHCEKTFRQLSQLKRHERCEHMEDRPVGGMEKLEDREKYDEEDDVNHVIADVELESDDHEDIVDGELGEHTVGRPEGEIESYEDQEQDDAEDHLDHVTADVELKTDNHEDHMDGELSGHEKCEHTVGRLEGVIERLEDWERDDLEGDLDHVVAYEEVETGDHEDHVDDELNGHEQCEL